MNPYSRHTGNTALRIIGSVLVLALLIPAPASAKIKKDDPAIKSGTATGTLAKIICEVIYEGDGDEMAARGAAEAMAGGDGKAQGHNSTEVETRTFTGTYTPPDPPAGKAGLYRLAIFSDDGCDVSVDKTKLDPKNLGKGQPLPDLGKSFHVLEDAFLTPGEPVHIKVEYSNCRYIQDGEEPDIDGCTLFVFLLPFDIETASIRSGQFVVNVPDVNQGATGTLDLIICRQGSTTEEVILKTLSSQAPGQVTITLDEIMNQDPSPLDGHDSRRYDRVKARWRVGNIDATSADKNLDVHAVEVLARRRISNYFSPTWGGTWGGNSLQKGVYPAGQFPAGLYNAARQTEFLNALDPANEGLAMDGNTVIRDQVRPAQAGFNRVIYLNGTDQGYIENPDRDQDNASSPSVTLLRATSVAVRTNADRLAYDEEVYIPEFSVRTVDDSGTLHGNTDQIDVWRGQGDQTLQNTVDNFGIRRRTCLKIIQAPTP